MCLYFRDVNWWETFSCLNLWNAVIPRLCRIDSLIVKRKWQNSPQLQQLSTMADVISSISSTSFHLSWKQTPDISFDLKLSPEALLRTLKVTRPSKKRRSWDLMMMSRKIPMITAKEVTILWKLEICSMGDIMWSESWAGDTFQLCGYHGIFRERSSWQWK